jgi:hypothetical protein
MFSYTIARPPAPAPIKVHPRVLIRRAHAKRLVMSSILQLGVVGAAATVAWLFHCGTTARAQWWWRMAVWPGLLLAAQVRWPMIHLPPFIPLTPHPPPGQYVALAGRYYNTFHPTAATLSALFLTHLASGALIATAFMAKDHAPNAQHQYYLATVIASAVIASLAAAIDFAYAGWRSMNAVSEHRRGQPPAGQKGPLSNLSLAHGFDMALPDAANFVPPVSGEKRSQGDVVSFRKEL